MRTQETRERDSTSRKSIGVLSIAALYTGEQDPTIEGFIQRAREIADDELPIGPPGDISPELLESLLLDQIGIEHSKREAVLREALSHAKGVLVGRKRSPKRDERLAAVNKKLSSLRQA